MANRPDTLRSGKDAGVPQKSRDLVLRALERMAQQISELEARVPVS